MRKMLAVSVAAVIVAIPGPARAGVQVVQLGTDAPPAVIAGMPFVPFALDTQPWGDDPPPLVTSAAMDGSNPPTGITVDFSAPVSHRRVHEGWSSWSHGYLGDVYFTEFADSITLLMPDDILGFYFYVQPNSFGLFPVTIAATTDLGSTATFTHILQGFEGASGYAFIPDAGDSLASITLSTIPEAFGIGFGEFGAALVPAPPALALLALASACRRRQR